MICVSIGRTRHKMVVAEHRRLAEKGAELVELRLDWLGRQPDLTRLLGDRPTPCIVTCRRREDRGRWRGTEEQRLALLRAAIVDGVEYVDLEEDIAGAVRRYGETKRIVSHHNFDETPEDIEEVYRRMQGLDPDVIKIATMANSPADMVRVLALVKDAEVPTVAFCMGELGMASRVLCGKYGAPFTYASFSKERELAPGQIAFGEMTHLYRFDQINDQTQVFGVIGDPLAHSYSPLVHNVALARAGVNAVYLPFRVPPDALDATLDAFDWLDLRGLSVTIPHKEAVLQRAFSADELVEEIGAANTLVRSDDGGWRACNTDAAAALAGIRLGLESSEGGSSRLAGRKVLLLGAGGAARAIGHALVHAGAAVIIANRSHGRAVQLAEELNCKQIKWEHRASEFADVLVNATPVGMFPEMDETPFAQNWLREGMLVFDTVYNPENTLLVKEARERGCRTVSGVEMFVRQAAGQFELFTGLPAPLDVMREALRKGISAVQAGW